MLTRVPLVTRKCTDEQIRSNIPPCDKQAETSDHHCLQKHHTKRAPAVKKEMVTESVMRSWRVGIGGSAPDSLLDVHKLNHNWSPHLFLCFLFVWFIDNCREFLVSPGKLSYERKSRVWLHRPSHCLPGETLLLGRSAAHLYFMEVHLYTETQVPPA